MLAAILVNIERTLWGRSPKPNARDEDAELQLIIKAITEWMNEQ